jgi:geranylgeranyl diphosphate synthase, type I
MTPLINTPETRNKSVPTPSNFLRTLRAQVDSALASCLQNIQARYAESSAEPIVAEVIRATLPKGGRMRPLLCCLGYAAVGGDAYDPRIVKAAASLELLHTFAIIHDDVMDGSPMRRGEPSIHRRLADERLAAGGRDAELHGISLAILAGDLALVVSDLLFAESGFPQEVLVEAYEPLSAMRLDAIAGQYLDLTHSGVAVEDAELTSRIARLKTGSYSVEGPLLVGATLGGGSARAKHALQAFGRPLGEAFQLADDLLGLFGDPAVTGKDVENDIRRGKPTALIARATEVAEPECRRLILSIWGNPLTTEKELATLRAAVRESGAVEVVASEIRRLISEATDALNDAESNGLSPAPCLTLCEQANEVLHRAEV